MQLECYVKGTIIIITIIIEVMHKIKYIMRNVERIKNFAQTIFIKKKKNNK